MRTVLLHHGSGWSQLSTDTGHTARAAAWQGFADVPGVGVAYTDGDTMVVTGPEVFAQEYAYILHLADRTLTVYRDGDLLWSAPEAAWAPIGPPCLTRPLPIVVADPVVHLPLAGVRPAYTPGHISRLMRTLELEPGDGLGISSGGDLFDFHAAAVTAGLLPDDAWFITDGSADDSDGGWIRLPVDISMADVQTLFIEAADFTDDKADQPADTRAKVRELLEHMAARIADATSSLNAWRVAAPHRTPRRAPVLSYAEACRLAAAGQGLDPICQALTRAGIAHDVEQTGGLCMVVTVPTPHGYRFGITASEKPDAASGGHWLLMSYDCADDGDEGHVIGRDLPTDAVIGLLHAHLSPAALAA